MVLQFLNMRKLRILFLLLFFSTALMAQWGDYTLYSLQNSTVAYLIKHDYSVYKSWTFPSNAKTGYSTYLLPGGELLRTVVYTPNSFSGGGQTGRLQKYDWNGNLLWDFVYCTSSYAMHHDICPMPNGNVLLIAYELKTPAQVIQAGGASSITVWSEKIVEVKQTGPTTGEIVWEWKLWDHLVQSFDSTKDNYVSSIAAYPHRLNINYKLTKDWIHMNGVDYNPILDQITFSSHNLNEIYVIDHSTTTAEAAGSTGGNAGKGGDFLYRWGNPAAYQRAGAQILNVVHDSHWIPEGVPNAGRMVAFNNKGYSSTRSSVDQIIPPLSGYNYTIEGTAAWSPLTYNDRHACNGYSSNMSSSQQLPNGNTFVCMATTGLLYEINAAGTTIWQRQLTGSVSKAWRYNQCYLDNPLPAEPEITLQDGILIASPAETWQWYHNGALIDGATNQTFTPQLPGNYLVRITQPGNCHYRYSASFKFDNATSVGDIQYSEIQLFPNPASDRVSIQTGSQKFLSAEAYSSDGRLLRRFDSQQLDINGLSKGVILVRVLTDRGLRIHKLIIQ